MNRPLASYSPSRLLPAMLDEVVFNAGEFKIGTESEYRASRVATAWTTYFFDNDLDFVFGARTYGVSVIISRGPDFEPRILSAGYSLSSLENIITPSGRDLVLSLTNLKGAPDGN